MLCHYLVFFFFTSCEIKREKRYGTYRRALFIYTLRYSSFVPIMIHKNLERINVILISSPIPEWGSTKIVSREPTRGQTGKENLIINIILCNVAKGLFNFDRVICFFHGCFNHSREVEVTTGWYP